MRKTSVGLVIAAAVCIGAWAGGCQEEQAPDVKMSRLISAENMQLKREIEALKKQINQCEEAQKDHQAQIERIKSISISANVSMNAEIERLKAEIARLNGQRPARAPVNQNEPKTDSASPAPPPPSE
jgi:outer membrane murein-binding lipoprotein Lpp